MICADCAQTARYEIRGVRKCTEHYIEALEHSAHIVSWINEYNRPYIPLPEPSVQAMKNYLDNPPNN